VKGMEASRKSLEKGGEEWVKVTEVGGQRING